LAVLVQELELARVAARELTGREPTGLELTGPVMEREMAMVVPRGSALSEELDAEKEGREYVTLQFHLRLISVTSLGILAQGPSGTLRLEY